jgi:hypothetical protein
MSRVCEYIQGEHGEGHNLSRVCSNGQMEESDEDMYICSPWAGPFTCDDEIQTEIGGDVCV